MGIIEAVRKVWSNLKLGRGQCRVCGRPLKDDETTAFCSDQCAEERMFTNGY